MLSNIIKQIQQERDQNKNLSRQVGTNQKPQLENIPGHRKVGASIFFGIKPAPAPVPAPIETKNPTPIPKGMSRAAIRKKQKEEAKQIAEAKAKAPGPIEIEPTLSE